MNRLHEAIVNQIGKETVGDSEKHKSDPQIPEDKRYFRIGEVSRIVGVEPYVLRYWESEFPHISSSPGGYKPKNLPEKGS